MMDYWYLLWGNSPPVLDNLRKHLDGLTLGCHSRTSNIVPIIFEFSLNAE